VLLALGKPERAIAALRQALTLDPRQSSTWTLFVQTLLNAGDRAGVLAAVDEACAIFAQDADVQDTLLDARRRALLATPRSGSSRPGRSALGRAFVSRFRAGLGSLPGISRATCAGRRIARHVKILLGQPDQLEIQASQLRMALGAVELRLAETEQRMHRELEAAWSQAHSLESALQQVNAALVEARSQQQAGWEQAHALDAALSAKADEIEAAWSRARQLDTALAEQTRNAQAAWTQAQRLDAALSEQSHAAEAAWANAAKLDAALAENVRDLKVAWARAQELDAALDKQAQQLLAAQTEAHLLTLSLSERDRRLRAAWGQAHRLDAALDEKDRELDAMRERVHRLEQALREAAPDGGRIVAGLSGQMHLG
jgi:hypothetical protein